MPSITNVVLQPMLYTCVLSNFNLPQLEACLTRRPSDVVLVVSDYGPAKQGADNLTALLMDVLPGICIHRPDLQASALRLLGDDLLNAQQWMSDVLGPYLTLHRTGKPCWLNLTGGTKAITLAMTLGYQWDQLDYKPAGQNYLHGYQFCRSVTVSSGTLSGLGDAEIPRVTPQQVARIYNQNFKEKSANPLRAHPCSLELAAAIFEGLQQKNSGLQLVFNALNRIWSEQRDKHVFPEWQKPMLSLPLDQFLNRTLDSVPSDLMAWLLRFQQLDARCFFLQEGYLHFPGNHPKNKKQLKAFREWVSGDWLEQLTGHWLLSSGVPEDAIAFGIKAGNESMTDQSREADLLIHFKGHTHVIEVKADIPLGVQPKEAEHQLGSLNAYGQIRRLLMVGPEFKARLEKNGDWQGYQARCSANNIRVCYSKEALLEAFNQ